MPTVIYVDVLLVLNFAINFLLLRLTAAAAGCPPSALRLALGAAVGADVDAGAPMAVRPSLERGASSR